MIIKKISIENFLCYYGVKEFELSNGLNIILGENGEGKTKFFEALEWLFNRTSDDLISLVSAKALTELNEEEELNVKVSITTEQWKEKQVVFKSFKVKKLSNNQFESTNLSLKGIEETSDGNRTPVDGQNLLDRIFPTEIRRYSMFKGESELDIFKNTDALEILINNLSKAARYYSKYSESGEFFQAKAQKAVEESTRKDKKKLAQYNSLKADIELLERDKQKINVQIDAAETEIDNLKRLILEAEKYVSNSKELKTINERIEIIEKKISNTSRLINENYTEGLFDENWILVNYESIQKDFSEKINKLSLEKRRLQSEFDKERGKKEGAIAIKAELLKNAVPLPENVPSKAIMDEMLNEEICKVCNRPAPVGSEAYNFMQARLENYLASQEFEEEETEEDLFKYDYITRLITINTTYEDSLKDLRSVETEIKDLFEFNEKRKDDIDQFREELEKEKEERNKLLGDYKGKEDDLADVLEKYNTWQNDLTKNNKLLLTEETSLNTVEEKLERKNTEKDKIDIESASNFLVKTRDILRDINTIFNETKTQKFNEFIQNLQDKSNEYFDRVNVDSFTGTIVFTKHLKQDRTSINVGLEENGRKFYKPNTSLLTSMHISILFAISELASEKKEEKFPLIFDAPTSSFGVNKTTEFLNLIYETGNQKILLLKDFLATNNSSNTLEIKKEFEKVKRNKAFWVRLQRPFNRKNLETINTEIISL